MRRIFLLLALCALVSCKRPAAESATTPPPAPTPEEGFAGVAPVSPPRGPCFDPADCPPEPVGKVEAPATVNSRRDQRGKMNW